MATGPGISLQDLRNRFQLSPQQLDREVSDEHLKEISKIITDHKPVGPELGLISSEMAAINSQRAPKTEMLKKWKQKFAFQATYKKLIEALLRCRRGDLARDVCKLLSKSERPIASAGPSVTQPPLHHGGISTGHVTVDLTDATGSSAGPKPSAQTQQASDISKEHQTKKRSRCGKCEACLAKPCGNCTPCKKKAEGQRYNRPCIKRQCPNMAFKGKHKATNEATEPKAKRAKVIKEGSNSALLSSASSSQVQAGVSCDLSMGEREVEEGGWGDFNESSNEDEHATEVPTPDESIGVVKKTEEKIKDLQAKLKEKEAELQNAKQLLQVFQASVMEKEEGLKKAEEKLKALQAALKSKETELKKAKEAANVLQVAKEAELKSCVSENQHMKNDLKRAESQKQKLMNENAEQIKALETENKKLREAIESLNTQVKLILESKAKLEQSKNGMKAKLLSFIRDL